MKTLEQKKMNGQLAWVGKPNVRMLLFKFRTRLKDRGK